MRTKWRDSFADGTVHESADVAADCGASGERLDVRRPVLRPANVLQSGVYGRRSAQAKVSRLPVSLNIVPRAALFGHILRRIPNHSMRITDMHRFLSRWTRVLPLAVLLGVAGGIWTGCDSNAPETTRPIFAVDDRGASRFDSTALRDRLSQLPLESVSDAEAASLQFLREEEKLARDVYRTLYETWSVPAFDNISSSEETHTTAVRLLLDRYDLPDPAADQPAGSFANAELQALHDSLVTVGQSDEVDALKVGAAVEEIDLVDLREALNTIVDNQDITLVYENLAKGSRNHLRAFVRTLQQRGETYEPRYLSPAEYQEIIEGEMERGPA